MSSDFQITGTNTAALFTLKIHRGDGMALLAMNWKKGQPPADFVGFAIEYKEPGGSKFFALKNRLSFRQGRRRGRSKHTVDTAFADPEISLGAFSPQCRSRRRLHLPRHAGVHE